MLAGTAAASPTLLIRGAGAGHGVGMSQEGALGYAMHHYSYTTILARYYSGTTIGHISSAERVRVLLQGNKRTASFSHAELANGHPLDPGASYTVKLTANHDLSLTGPGLNINAAHIDVSASEPVSLLGAADNGVRDGLYRGSLEFAPALHGGLVVINSVPIESYVAGTIAGEVSSSWPASALAAQAVASRTYALTAHAGPSGEFDVYSDTRSQLYRGILAETATTNAAVRATARQVVTYRGHPVITYFFASSGGQTEDVQNAFPGSQPAPWLQGVPDPFDRGPLHSWSISMSFSTAAARLGNLVRGSFRGVEVLKRGYSPRILWANVIGSAGRTQVSGAALSARLGLYGSWAYFSVRTAHGLTPEPDLSSTVPQAPSELASSAQGGTSPEQPTG
jgi:stage II sporulation protein D